MRRRALLDTLRIYGYSVFCHQLARINKIQTAARIVYWQTACALSKEPRNIRFVNESRLLIGRGFHGATGNIYCGLADFEEMSFLLHFLREGDYFADVGANAGAYTVLASAVAKARSISLEPDPLNYSQLLGNIAVNHIEGKVTPLNIAAWKESSSLPFTQAGAMSHILTGDKKVSRPLINVNAKKLDDIIAGGGGRIPALVKIDTEGAEGKVLEGSQNIMKDTGLKAVIIELWKRKWLHERFLAYGFSLCDYNPWLRKLTLSSDFRRNNAIYARDIDWVRERLAGAAKFKVLGYVL